MNVIFKYQLDAISSLRIPRSAVVRVVAWQRTGPCIWIELDPEKDSVDRKFVVVGTGQPVPVGGVYVGTAVSDHLVYHVYEI